MATRPAPRRGGVDRRLLYAGAAVLALVVFLYLRSHRAAGALEPGSGTPGPAVNESAAQQPSGGAASVPGHLPNTLLTAPDTLQQQVQQSNATDGTSPTMMQPQGPQPTIQPVFYLPPGGNYNPPPGLPPTLPPWNQGGGSAPGASPPATYPGDPNQTGHGFV